MESEQPWESTGIVRPSRPRVLRELLRVGWGGGGVGIMTFFACAHM